MSHKVIIAGAGPIGCYLAQILKKNAVNPLLIEEHKEIGRPVHCAGLVGKKVFEETKIALSSDCILNAINGAVIYAGNNKIILKRKEVAYVIDREKFDKQLGKGLEIKFETRFLGLEKENGSYIIETDKGYLKADIVISAEGARSLARDFIGANHMEYLKGVQFRMQLEPQYSDMVEVYIKRPYFYWLIPEAKGIVRIGVLSKNPYSDLLDFIKDKKISGKILETFAGTVPLNHFSPLVKERLFLVGDSASQVKPLSYGGIYMGMRSAEILADCIIKNKFSDYNALWMKRFGKEVNLALKAREVFYRLSDSEIEKLFSFIKERSDIIEKMGDFENHSQLLWEFLKYPKLSRDILGIFLKIVKQTLEPVSQ
jgi:geranylgeranyl reductase family protein